MRRIARLLIVFLIALAACSPSALPASDPATRVRPTAAPIERTAQPTAVPIARSLFPGVPAHPLMEMMTAARLPDAQVGLGGKTLTGQVELRSVQLVRPESADLAAIRQFYRAELPALGWQPLADYPGGTLYRRPAADGANEPGLMVTLTAVNGGLAVFDALRFEARGAVGPLSSVRAAAIPWGPDRIAPQSIAVSAAGEIYVASMLNHTVYRLAADGSVLGSWGGGAGPGAFGDYKGPSGVAVGPDGSVFVADPGNGRVQKFAPDGRYLASFGENLSSYALYSAAGIAVAADGTIYLAAGGKILVLDSDGSLRATWPVHLSPGHRHASVEWIAVGPTGSVYVSDYANNVIQKYSPLGSFLTEWGAMGYGPGQLDGPMGLAVAGERLYVVDEGNGRIQSFSLDGALLGVIGGRDDEPAFRGGRGIAVTAGGNVLVADDDSLRIESLAPAGAPALGSGHPAASDVPLPDPQGVALLPARLTDQEWIELGRRWLRGEPCAAPCWEGVTPGVTTVGAALDLLKRSPLIDPASVGVFELIDGGNEAVIEAFVSWTWIGNDYDGGKAAFKPAPPLPPPTPATNSGGDTFDIRPVEPDAALLAQIVTSISPNLGGYQPNPADHRP
ncbi:MAG TPA: NHL repeat-containing protein, partial [Herpetosiphonaceae bacterium]|nr:NHL repeat-containing protein [Herpetosiphonaceae bacterium]